MILLEIFVFVMGSFLIALAIVTTKNKIQGPKHCCPSHFCTEPARMWNDPKTDKAVCMCKQCYDKFIYKLEQMEGGHA